MKTEFITGHNTLANGEKAMKIQFLNLKKAVVFGLMVGGLMTSPLHAKEFSNGEWSGSFDTTISYGAAWRASDLDEDNIGKGAINPTTFLLDNAGQRAAPGRWSVNSDDGNLNYPDGGDLVSNTIKFTSELDVKWRTLVDSPVLWVFTILKMSTRIFCPKRQKHGLARTSVCLICTSGVIMRWVTAF